MLRRGNLRRRRQAERTRSTTAPRARIVRALGFTTSSCAGAAGSSLPVTIRVTFENAESQDFEWTREMQFESRWWRLPIPAGPEKVESVIIDPDRLWFLDRDMSNNQWFAEPDELAPLRWGERALTRSGNVLQWLMAVGG